MKLASIPNLAPAQPRAEAFRRETNADGVCSLTFDMPGPANLLNEDTLRELDDHLEIIAHDPSIKALVFRSAKDRIFIAGADLRRVQSLPPSKFDGLILLGQAIYNRIANLPIPTIAAIHGACVGGGLELTLACRIRIATSDKSTRLGLPETQLGLIPAWGGCTRLPRLIGLPAALDLILNGKILKPEQALKLGLIHQVVHREHLDAAVADSVRWCIGFSRPKTPPRQRLESFGQPSAAEASGCRRSTDESAEAYTPTAQSQRSPTFLSNHHPFSDLILWKAGRDLRRKTRGLYEAPLRALEVIGRGLHLPQDEALDAEREAMVHLAKTSSTRHLIELFFRKEEAGKRCLNGEEPLPITQVAVIGAGVMGAGIAHWLASKGVHVLLCDVSPEAIGSGIVRIQTLLKEAVKRKLISRQESRTTMDRIATTHESVPLHRYPLVIEAATERMDLKKKIFASLAGRCGKDTILATNTSALSVAELATATPHPERVVGLHFFNPVHRMPLVEVITTDLTLDEHAATAFAFAQAMGKTPVWCKDSPGFIVNRILTPYLMEAVRLWSQGHPTLAIDEAMQEYGMPMGPLRLLDEIGLDVAAHVAETLGLEATLLDPMLSNGHLGKKSGKGFYDHKTNRPTPQPPIPTPDPLDLQTHLLELLEAEARKVQAEGVTRSEADINLAMVLGYRVSTVTGRVGVISGTDSTRPTVKEYVSRLNPDTKRPGKVYRRKPPHDVQPMPSPRARPGQREGAAVAARHLD